MFGQPGHSPGFGSHQPSSPGLIGHWKPCLQFVLVVPSPWPLPPRFQSLQLPRCSVLRPLLGSFPLFFSHFSAGDAPSSPRLQPSALPVPPPGTPLRSRLLVPAGFCPLLPCLLSLFLRGSALLVSPLNGQTLCPWRQEFAPFFISLQ